MWTWLTRLFRSPAPKPSAPAAALPAATDGTSDDAHDDDEEEESEADEPPSWAEALHESVQRLARAQARLDMRLDGIQSTISGGFADLARSTARTPPPDSEPDPVDWAPLFDALDVLDVALDVASDADKALAHGLRLVADRLGAFIESRGFARIRPRSGAPDGRLFRVVGSEPHPSVEAGSVARMVRAAIFAGSKLVREGEVLVSAGAERPERPEYSDTNDEQGAEERA